jgi:hypothetical protein
LIWQTATRLPSRNPLSFCSARSNGRVKIERNGTGLIRRISGARCDPGACHSKADAVRSQLTWRGRAGKAPRQAGQAMVGAIRRDVSV